MQEADRPVLDILNFIEVVEMLNDFESKFKQRYPKTGSITNLVLQSNNSIKDQISIIYKHLPLS